MSKSAKIYIGAALVLVVFPLLAGLLSSTSAAIIAVVLIGVGAYGFAVCLLIASFWYRYRYGAWPVDVDDELIDLRQEEPREVSRENGGFLYRANQVLLGWFNRHFSNV